MLSGLAMIASGVPSATRCPPCTPAPGPISMTQSAVRIASSSCSTTMTVLPRSRSRFSVSEQAPVVALVQPDRRLVEDIEHAGQPRADLRGQPDALALAARQRARGPRQGQVFEPDILQEAEALVDLLEDALGDLALARGQLVLDPGEPDAGLGDRQRRDLADVLAGDLDRERLGLEPVAAAHLAGLGTLVAAELLLTQALSVSRKRRSMFGNTPSNGRSVVYFRSPSS